jgi:type IV pilus assembly protein PilV
MQRPRSLSSSRGFTLIEVLVTAVVLAIGLLGLGLLQVTSLNNQLEAYHRAQAMMMMEEMSNRIRVNNQAALAGNYTDGTDYGLRDNDDFGLAADENCSDIVGDAPQRDLCEWNTALSGAGVKLGDVNLGSVNGAIGCIENLAGSGDGDVIIRLTIAWQGMAETEPPVSTCGQNAFGNNEGFRRVAIFDTVVADLAI